MGVKNVPEMIAIGRYTAFTTADEPSAERTALVRTAEGSSAVVNAVYLPMAIIAGTFFTPREYPGFLRAIADVLPLTYFTKLTRDVMVRDHHLWSELGSLAIVLGWGAIGVLAAIRGFRWQPREG